MSDEQAGSALDPEIVEAALGALEQGRKPDPDELLARFPGQLEQIQRALDAVDSYRRRVEDHRRSSRTPMDVEHLGAGTVLGEFEIAGPLGRGNMGVVYRARQRSLGDREVALKILPLSLVARDPRFAERFQREAELASAVHHPNVAEVYGFGSQDEQAYFAMQLVEGRTLEDVLGGLVRRHQLGASRHMQRDYMRLAAGLVHGVAQALATIHAEGLMHRDVKPSNIILEGAPGDDEQALRCRPVLIDFGLLRPVGDSDLTGSRTLLGTPAFAAPEAQLGREVDARADVFSLGVILHDLLTLTRARGRSLASAGLSDLGSLNPAVHPDLAAIVRKALEEQPGLRYADGASLAADLDRFLRDKPVRARPSTPFGVLRLWARRDPVRATRFAVLAGVAALLIASLGWLGSSVLAHYAARTQMFELEARGELLGASAAAATLLNGPAAFNALPGLGAGLDHARSLYSRDSGQLADPCDLLTAAGADGRERSKELRSAHVQLLSSLMTPGNEEPHGPILRFLIRELGDPAGGWRRSIAAESLAHFLCIRPLGHDGLAEGSIERDLADTLHAVLEAPAESESQVSARLFAASALSGVVTPRSLGSLVAQIDAEHRELRRVAIAGSLRLWWELRDRDALASIDPDLWIEWILATDRVSRGLPSDVPYNCLQQVYYAVAWTRGWLERASQPWDGTRLPPELDAYLRELQGAMTTPSLDHPLALIEGRGGLSRQLFSADLRRIREGAWEVWNLESARESQYRYENVWDPEQDRASPRIPNQPEGDSDFATFDIDPATGAPALGGAATGCEWVNATPHVLGSQTTVLHFDSPGKSLLRLTSDTPRAAKRARISLRHCYPNRFFMPFRGSAVVRITAGGRGQTIECDVPSETGELVFFVDLDGLNSSAPFELLIEFVAGTSTYWLEDLRIEFWQR